VGDIKLPRLLLRLSQAYGCQPPATLPVEDVKPEPPQTSERRVEVAKPTAADKLIVGYHSPALGDFDHPALSLLSEILFGGRASRLHHRLVQDLELASEVRAFVGPFRDPSLFDLYVSAREGHPAEELLKVIDEELDRVREQAVSPEEIERACARLELSFLAGLETVEGKASTIGFYETVLRQPGLAFERLEQARHIGPGDLLRVARRYLVPRARTVIVVRPELASNQVEEAAE
jgi:zinc protease